MVALAALLGSCDALNPAFVDFIGTSFEGVTVNPQGPGSAGHVVIAFRNDTVFDEQLLDYLISRGLDPALTEQEDLRPRVRMLMMVIFTNGESLQVEFNDGSATIIDPAVNIDDFPELVRTEQSNLVVQCDVARLSLLVLPSIFVPVPFQTVRIEEVVDAGTFRVNVNTNPPQFVVLEPDDVDNFGNTVLLRNVDIRDLPAPAIGPNCGSVITIVINGTLRVPFVSNEFGNNVPGVLDTNFTDEAASPGRYSIDVGIR